MAVGTWPEVFAAKQMAATDGTQYVRLGGEGPAVLLLHGFGDTGDMWVPLADALVKDHAVIVPDLRGMGLSSHPEGGYEKVAQARDLIGILDQLGFQEVALVTHDIGNMVVVASGAFSKRWRLGWLMHFPVRRRRASWPMVLSLQVPPEFLSVSSRGCEWLVKRDRHRSRRKPPLTLFSTASLSRQSHGRLRR